MAEKEFASFAASWRKELVATNILKAPGCVATLRPSFALNVLTIPCQRPMLKIIDVYNCYYQGYSTLDIFIEKSESI